MKKYSVLTIDGQAILIEAFTLIELADILNKLSISTVSLISITVIR